MSLVQQLRDDQLQARKDKDKFTAQTLTTILGEVLKIGKDDGNRETTDVEAVKICKKFRKSLTETINLARANKKPYANEETELITVNQYIPEQLTENQITTFLMDYVIVLDAEDTKLSIPLGMKFMKDYYDGRYDGKLASIVLKDVIANL